MTCAMPLIPIVVSVVVMGTSDMFGVVLPAEHAVGCRQHPLIRASCTLVCQANAIDRQLGEVDDRRRMLIEVVALEPPHHDEGVLTIHLEKLLTAEASEVNSLNAVFGGGV